ncbi:MAG: GNAT family N-acetyltransferase [Proteobacteria bacterium]|nr:MAG: GNAT family N-acetyltransferase [Pseudomonadota bacterium]
MSPRTNSYGQPIGDAVANWTERPRPPRTRMQGRHCRLEPLSAARHAEGLHAAYARDADGRHWTYLPYGPFGSAAEYASFVRGIEKSADPQFFAIVDEATSQPLGVASYLRIDPSMGVVEVGHLRFSSLLQGTTAASEAMYLMMRRAFEELGYRRYEWKCDALNAPSRAAAERFGFQYEGTFRNALVTKGRNRDTAWYSIIASEWPAVQEAFEAWLAPANFDAAGKQVARLGDRMRDAFARAGLRRG